MIVLKVWAIVNLIGIAIATAAGIFRDLTEDEYEREDQ